jgi:chemotaxis protein CheX
VGFSGEIADKLIASTNEIFTGMVMMEIESIDPPVEPLGQMKKSITGMIGLAGTFKGVLAIHFSNDIAMAVTGSFLGLDVEEINEDVHDAVGEIANMLGGDLKAILSDKGKDIQLSLPSTIGGDEYVFNSRDTGEQLILSFKVPAGVFHVEVQLEK